MAVSGETNTKTQLAMEDAHAFIYNYGNRPDEGYFALFDGHAGAQAAQWCAKSLHTMIESSIQRYENLKAENQAFPSIPTPTPSVSSRHGSNISIQSADSSQKSTSTKKSESGSKPVFKLDMAKVAAPISRINQSRPPTDQHYDYFLTSNPKSLAGIPKSQLVPLALNSAFVDAEKGLAKDLSLSTGCTAAVAVLRWESTVMTSPMAQASLTSTRGIPNIKKGLSLVPTSYTTRDRVLYTANVGDTRLILCRGGRAIRLSYDHKASDPNEVERVISCGGKLAGGRVNGMLAVTRSLGDGYMKSLVSGRPYTTRTILGPHDDFFILACDGLWDVCNDQTAVDLVRAANDPKQAAKVLTSYALDHGATDNVTCMVVRLDPDVC